MRGAHRHCGRALRNWAGSPPHARGPLPVLSLWSIEGGITPACAGPTSGQATAGCNSRDHPRMRGAHFTRFCVAVNRAGSPPHARGPQTEYFVPAPTIRITPACAGPTYPSGTMCSGLRDHPRMRGAHRGTRVLEGAEKGSPPHARGPLCRCPRLPRQCRITPACAGPTQVLQRIGAGVEDHPRMRGAHEWINSLTDDEKGSPPHARGPRAFLIGLVMPRRITPACAGPTDIPFVYVRKGRDHPRMRGAHVM